MDCARFESTLIDELYEELDELTSAAAKKHVAGCAKCSALMGGLRATRSVALLPIEESPDGLEDRILAAVKNAQKVVPLKGRMGRGFTSFGAFAMKPQVAIAAVFVLMVGASVVLLQTKGGEGKSASQTMASAAPHSPAASARAEADGLMAMVDPDTEKGGKQEWKAPEKAAASATAAASASAAPVAIAALEQQPTSTATVAPTVPVSKVPANADKADDKRVALADQLPPAPGRVQSRAAAAPPPPAAPRPGLYGGDGYRGEGNNNAPAVAEVDITKREHAAAGAGGPGGAAAMIQARTAFDAGRWQDAFRIYDTLAPSNIEAAFQAARSLMSLRRFDEAASRFDDLSMRGAGTPNEFQAIYEAAQAYRAKGDLGAARERLSRLLDKPAFAARAQRDLTAIGPRKAVATVPVGPQATTTTQPAQAQQQQQQSQPPATTTAKPPQPADANQKR